MRGVRGVKLGVERGLRGVRGGELRGQVEGGCSRLRREDGWLCASVLLGNVRVGRA